MNPFIKKEIRLLLPSFLIGCAMTLSNLFLLWQGNLGINSILYLFPFVVCPAVGVMIALNSFGGEISAGTFTTMLAQPVSRLKIWQTKIVLLALSLLILAFLWSVSFVLSVKPFGSNTDFNSLLDMLAAVTVFGLAAFSGGLWTVLLLRQAAAAFWFTLLLPGVILIVTTGFFGGGDGNFFEGVVVIILGLYSLSGFFFARWLFLRAQDVQWSGGTIVMPEMRGLPAWFSKSVWQRNFRPRAALWRKEFQLHQSQFIMAFALLLLHLGVLLARNFCDLTRSPDLKYILEVFWGLWFVMPVLVGCAAVAEERKIGTLESQLCLPVKRRTQFAVKFSVMLFVSMLLGVVMPLLLEGTKILPNAHFEFSIPGNFQPGWQNQMSTLQFFFWNCLGMLNGFLPLLVLAGTAAAFGTISFYVSSFTRNTLQTLAPAVLGILLASFAFIMVSQMQSFDLNFLWRGALPFFIVVPLLLLAMLALAFWNYQHVAVNWKIWRRNFLLMALTLVFAVLATTAVYHRFWEKFTPFEPPHGVARLSQSNPASLSARWDEFSVRLPDGKIWMNHFVPSPTAFNPLALMLGNVKVTVADGKFINGSNWLTVNRTRTEFIGLKNDGSLWISERLWQTNRSKKSWLKLDDDAIHRLVPSGNGTNWGSLLPIGYSALLVKNDGTLWRWGATNFDFKHDQWPGLRTMTPSRLGTESNWAEVFQYNNEIFLRQTNGSVWAWADNWNTNGQTSLQLEPGITVQSPKNLGSEKFSSTATISHGLQFDVGVRADGTFRIWADERLHLGKRYANYERFPADVQIGNETNWIAVAGNGEKIVTLKNDGSLWLWDFHLKSRQIFWDTDRFEREIQRAQPVRLGTHSDWIAISGDQNYVNSLAADGSLWFWPLVQVDYRELNGIGFFGNGNSHFEPLLDISRKPQFLANVFSGEN